ncbi:ABC transporter substrate-binding protein [Sutcliffiella horikoshii]|uniref:ABC transporter substrate-binding protein n=1 Tax=Sutcliffiella horikoshii TaxID=79883 RepID=A0A1Y0CNR6_9BACI|nr:ABC transporter substrate-binding protein [Sutcliffiella horikoshii]ART76636.1 ABC transporter substrate-binding protein [Sutcliffiella horikoshii]TYS57997.1 ABC transporter substrate-binding protein [Sutcliffiella horikoshii]
MKHIKQKWGIIGLVFILFIGIVTGCGSTSEQTNGNLNDSVVENTSGEEQSQNSAFPITITDDSGQEITIETEPETIVSMQPSNTEIAYALGLGDRMIGVSDYCNYPAQTADVEKVGGQDMNAEMILTLMPDVIFVTDYHHQNHEALLKQYREAGISVIVIGSESSFADVYETIELIGKATGTSGEADKLVADMKERLLAVQEKAKQVTEEKKVWVEVSPAPDIFTTGQGTFMHEMLESIQAENAAGNQEGWVKLTEEEIVQLNPDVIITTYGYYVDNPKEGVMTRSGWEEVPAIKNGNVHDVDSDTVTRPGPRLIEGVEHLAKLIYPEIFE